MLKHAMDSDANQQVSKVEDEGDDNRDEGSASAEQDEVGCEHLMERRGLISPEDILSLNCQLENRLLSQRRKENKSESQTWTISARKECVF